MVVLNRRCLLGFAVAGVLVPTVRAQTPAVESMLRRFSREVKCAEGSFEQKAFARDGKIRETFSGTFAFLRPGRFVWQYEKPYRQSIISNGKTLWMYDEDLMQVVPVDAGTLELPEHSVAAAGVYQQPPLAVAHNEAGVVAGCRLSVAGSKQRDIHKSPLHAATPDPQGAGAAVASVI